MPSPRFSFSLSALATSLWSFFISLLFRSTSSCSLRNMCPPCCVLISPFGGARRFTSFTCSFGFPCVVCGVRRGARQFLAKCPGFPQLKHVNGGGLLVPFALSLDVSTSIGSPYCLERLGVILCCRGRYSLAWREFRNILSACPAIRNPSYTSFSVSLLV